MTTGLKAIETVYKGYRFRSRLEARWAVFLDTLGITYEYEQEGFDLGDGVSYLPDFWLPKLHYWLEIKGSDIQGADFKKVYLLGQQSGYRVFVFPGNIGIPEARKVGAFVQFVGGSVATMFGSACDRWLNERCMGWVWGMCPRCSAVDIVGLRDDGKATHGLQDCHCADPVVASSTRYLRYCYESARSARFEHGESGSRW